MRPDPTADGWTVGRPLVLSACTGLKALRTDSLSLSDLRSVTRRRALLDGREPRERLPAGELYLGAQHCRLTEGVRAAAGAGCDIDVRIVSAGFGLVESTTRLPAYDATFSTMARAERAAWGAELGLPLTVRSALAAPRPFALVLLGSAYMDACALEGEIAWGAPTIVLGGQDTVARFAPSPSLVVLPLGVPDTRLFAAGLVALKGAVAAGLLGWASMAPASFLAALERGDVAQLREQALVNAASIRAVRARATA
jgi:hypothetical protein